MHETSVPKYTGSIAKLGLDSREDLGITIMGGLAVYLFSKSLMTYGLKDLIAAIIGALCWRFLFVPAMMYYRKNYPPQYPMHWLRARVLLAPILRCKPDSDPQPGVIPDHLRPTRPTRS